MNSTFDEQENVDSTSLSDHLAEGSTRQAKVTGSLCIACAAAAVGFGLINATLFYVFLFFAAGLGILGYSEIKAIGKGRLSSVVILMATVVLIILFISLFSTTNSTQFWVFLGLLSVLVPLLLAPLALWANSVEKWKALIPLVIPIVFIFSASAASSKGGLAILLMPVGWGLLGFVAYQGRR